MSAIAQDLTAEKTFLVVLKLRARYPDSPLFDSAKHHAIYMLRERIALKALIRSLAESSPDGMMDVYHWSRDCDGCEGDRTYRIPATIEAFDHEYSEIDKWADGPFAFRPITREAAETHEPYWRDRGSEAHENGHPYRL